MRALAFVSLLLLATAASAQELALEPANVLSWPRVAVNRFGCMLEQSYGAQSTRFGCAQTNYVNRGNPCTAAEAFYEGPRLPADLATRVSPLLHAIDVKYEGGKVQAVTLFFKARQTETAIRVALGLPESGAALPLNVVTLTIDGCRADGPTQLCNIVLLEGFEHQGAGDGSCGDETPPDPTPDGTGTTAE